MMLMERIEEALRAPREERETWEDDGEREKYEQLGK